MIDVGNPYQDMLSAIPLGAFYDPHGTILPYSDQPYSFRLATAKPNTRYDIILNSQPAGSVVTDASGVALVKVMLGRGDNRLTLNNSIIKSVLTSYISTRDWATWLASMADVLGPLDTQAQQLLADRDISTVGFDRIDTIWGRRLHNDNRLGYSSDTYRELLQILQRGYRRHGGHTAGLMEAIGAFTHVNPLIFRRNFGPTWYLGNQFALNPMMDMWATALAAPVFVNMSVGGATVSIDEPTSQFRGDVGLATLAYNAGTHTFTFTTASGQSGTAVISPGDTYVTIYTKPSPNVAIAFSEPGPFDTSSTNKLAIELDNHGIINIILTSSATLSVASVVSSINAALSADPRYGAPYATAASSVNGRVKITSGTAGEIKLHPSVPTTDAAHVIFGIPWSYSTVSVPISGLGPTPTTFTLNLADTSSFPVLDSENTYYIIISTAPTAPTRVYEVKANDVISGTLTLYNTGTLLPIPIGSSVYVQGQLSHVWSSPSDTGGRKLTLNLTHSELLLTASDTFTIGGSILPAGWWPITTLASITPQYVRQTAWMDDGAFQIVNNNTNPWTIETQLKSSVAQYPGMPIDAGIWVARDYADITTANIAATVAFSLSFDGGSTWTTTSISLPSARARIPVYIGVKTTIPVGTTAVLAKIDASNLTSTGVNIRIERMTVRVGSHSGHNLGRGTIPRNQHRSKRDYLCYIWSPSALTVDEKALIGLPMGTRGHIDTVAPAHVSLSRFDVSEYSGGAPQNLAGVLTGLDLATCTLSNMSVIVRSPARFSYAQPIATSAVVGESVVPTGAGPWTFTLGHPTAQDLSQIVLYDNGIPVVKNILSFTGPSTLQMSVAPIASHAYTIDYQILTRLETLPIAVTGTPSNYSWYADAFQLLGLDFTPDSLQVTKGIQFNGNFIAQLDERSDQDKATSILYADDGEQQLPVDSSSWEYTSAQSILIDPTVFNPQALYLLAYNARIAHPAPRAAATLEYRQGSSSVACLAATYAPFIVNQPVPPAAYIQFRVTYKNVIDPTEVRLYSIMIKGLNMQAGTVPVLNNRVWTPIPKAP